MYVIFGGEPVKLPCAGPVTIEKISGLNSGSLALRKICLDVSCAMMIVCGVAVGGSFTGVIVIETVAGTLSWIPLFTLNLKLSEPLVLRFGV